VSELSLCVFLCASFPSQRPRRFPFASPTLDRPFLAGETKLSKPCRVLYRHDKVLMNGYQFCQTKPNSPPRTSATGDRVQPTPGDQLPAPGFCSGQESCRYHLAGAGTALIKPYFAGKCGLEKYHTPASECNECNIESVRNSPHA